MPGTPFASCELLQVITAPNPSPFTLEGTNTYLLGRGQVAVIDPGPEDPGHVAAVLDHVRRSGGDIALILVTHLHRDHAGALSALAAATGAPVGRWHGGDRPLADGDVLTLGELRLRVLHTPGHAPDHVVFHWEQARVLFSGDLVLGRGTVMVAPPSGSMDDYMRSLERVAELDLAVIAPGHGPAIRDPAAWVRGYLEHRREREHQILELLAGSPRTPAQLVDLLYTSLDPRLRRAAEATVEAHLLRLARRGVVRQEGDRYVHL